MELEPKKYNIDEFIKLYEGGGKDDSDLFTYAKRLGLDQSDFFDYEFWDKDKRKGYFEDSPKGKELRKYDSSYYKTLQDEYFGAHDKLNLVTKEKDILSGDEYRKQPGSRGASQSDFDSMDRWSKRFKEQSDKEKLQKDKTQAAIDEAKAKAEEKAAYDKTTKGKFNKFWEDGSKRNALLNAVSNTLLETRVGADAYGNRFRDLPGNITTALQTAEATDMIKTQAALDMMKTEAETNKLNNPQQWLSDKQKQAKDIASQSYTRGTPEWAAAYERELRQIAAPDLLSGSMEGITSINEFLFKYGSALDQQTKDVMKSLVTTLVNQVNESGGTGAPSQEVSTIYAPATN